jgi:hypothetical protein
LAAGLRSSRGRNPERLRHGRPAKGKYCAVQVQGDGASIRRYRVKLLGHESDQSTYPRNWPPKCPGFLEEIQNAWEGGGRPHGPTCVVKIEVENPISGYKLICHPSPS